MGTLSLPPAGSVYLDANAFIYDPDEGLEIKRAMRTRLLRQQKAVAAGERGRTLNDVARELGLD